MPCQPKPFALLILFARALRRSGSLLLFVLLPRSFTVSRRAAGEENVFNKQAPGVELAPP